MIQIEEVELNADNISVVADSTDSGEHGDTHLVNFSQKVKGQ